MKIAVVGTGISGLVTAHLLSRSHDVTVLEAGDYIGGHTNTVDVEVDGQSHAVDTGFIVYNEANYPGFVRLLDQLDVETQPSVMSFSVTDAVSGLSYRGSNLNTLFAQRRNILRPAFHRVLRDIVRFNRASKRLLKSPPDGSDRLTLGEFIDSGQFSDEFLNLYLVPLGSSIWSADPETFLEFPALTYARFMNNHGILDVGNAPPWRTVTGGSRSYVRKIVEPIRDRVRLNTPVQKIRRLTADNGDDAVEILTDRHGPETFDRVVLTCHSDQALRMLADPSCAEREILGSIRYQRNTALLHTDENMLPRIPRVRAAWNFHQGVSGGSGATLTYWMNELQSIESTRPLLVTLNRDEAVDDASVLESFEYFHPVFDLAAIEAQERRAEIQGARGTYFAGAYWGFGFHEDGLQSALDVCRHFGESL